MGLGKKKKSEGVQADAKENSNPSSASSASSASSVTDIPKAQFVGSPGLWWFLSVVVAGLTIFAYVTPLTTETPEPRPYTVQYDFDYTAEIPPNPVYESGTLMYGQPIFLNIIDEVTTNVTYSINNPNVRIDDGQLVLKSILIGSAGWTRVLAQSEPVAFSGATQASASLNVNFDDALAVAAENNAATGTQSTLNIRVVAETYVNGELLKNGKAPGGLDERTTADIVFNLKENSANVMLPARTVPTGGTTGAMGGLVPGTAGASTQTGGASTQTGGASSETGSASGQTGSASGQTGSASGQSGSASTETGGASTETGYLSSESGYLEFYTGIASTETGYLSEETGYLSTEFGGANSGTGTANSTSGGANQNTGGSGDAPSPAQDPSIKSITQMVPTDVNVPNKVGLGFVEFPVDTARLVMSVLLGLFVLLALYNTLVARKVKHQGTIAQIIAMHGKRIIPMASFNPSKVKDAVVLPTFDAIHAVSLETEQLIMIRPLDDGSGAEFWVSDNGTVYMCTVEDEKESADTEPLAGQTGDGAAVEGESGGISKNTFFSSLGFTRLKNKRFNLALPAVGLVAVAGIAGAAFAASISTGTDNAGQGITVTAGYTAGQLDFTGNWLVTSSNDTGTDLWAFGFELKKAADGTGTSSVTDANTTVYAQLTTDSGDANWVLCEIYEESDAPMPGFALCTVTGNQTKPLGEVTGVNVVAYDK